MSSKTGSGINILYLLTGRIVETVGEEGMHCSAMARDNGHRSGGQVRWCVGGPVYAAVKLKQANERQNDTTQHTCFAVAARGQAGGFIVGVRWG